LSSLLAAAHDNRAELEDRIAQARQNRRSGANKYGQSSLSLSLSPPARLPRFLFFFFSSFNLEGFAAPTHLF
jgi:hypothetical protein